MDLHALNCSDFPRLQTCSCPPFTSDLLMPSRVTLLVNLRTSLLVLVSALGSSLASALCPKAYDCHRRKCGLKDWSQKTLVVFCQRFSGAKVESIFCPPFSRKFMTRGILGGRSADSSFLSVMSFLWQQAPAHSSVGAALSVFRVAQPWSWKEGRIQSWCLPLHRHTG